MRWLDITFKETELKNAPLMRSTSGIRGIVGASLDPIVLAQYTAAFGKFVNHGRVVIGSDGRPSGDHISVLVMSTLTQSGCEVIDLGIVPGTRVTLERSYHVATIDYDADLVVARVVEFAKRLTGA